ncbi:MAG: hypothetical protein HOJ61_01035 [Gammaproteobacteria bacterium]|nr:hypothetical protein [Gammaproteobacteria bacterium]
MSITCRGKRIMEVIPLDQDGVGIGMSRAEIFEHADALYDFVLTISQMQVTLLFGFLVAAYLVAHKLNRTQLVVGVGIYSFVYLTQTAVAFSFQERMYLFVSYAGIMDKVSSVVSDTTTTVAMTSLNANSLFLASALIPFVGSLYFAYSCIKSNQRNNNSDSDSDSED